MSFELYATLMILVFIAMVRARLVFDMHKRRLHEIHAANLKSIEGLTDKDLNSDLLFALVARYDDIQKQYNWHVFDLTKWTYKQFFPEPA